MATKASASVVVTHEAAPAAAAGAERQRARTAAGDAQDAVDALRARLAGASARGHAALGYLADDLQEAREALAAVGGWVSGVEAALADADPSQPRLLALALGGGPVAQVEALSTVLASLRRRLAQVAARM